MAALIGQSETAALLEKHLLGYVLNKIEYYICGWNLRFIHPSGKETEIHAAEMSVPEQIPLAQLSQEAMNTLEPEDTHVAIILFTAINKWPIEAIQLSREGRVNISFKNGSVISVLGVVAGVDWAWQARLESESTLLTCDTGSIYKSVL